MKCIFMYNPESGKGQAAAYQSYITEKLRKKYNTVDVYKTQCPKDFTRKVREIAGEYDAIIFAGGDGSFNEVLQGLAPQKNRPVLGYIPTGTVNDIARAVKIPRTIKRAVKTIINGKPKSFDIMKVNDSYAMYSISAGAFTSVSYMAAQSQKKVLGRLAYGLEGLKNNIRFKDFAVKLKTCDYNCETQTVFILIMNGRSVAGFNINLDGKMDDGKLELIIVKQQKNPTFFKRLGAFYRVIKIFIFGYRYLKEKNIERIEGSHFEFETSEDVVWNYDGEMGSSGNIVIDVLPKHIEVIVPQKKIKFPKIRKNKK